MVLAALEVIVTLPVNDELPVGVKVTEIEQLWPTFRTAEDPVGAVPVGRTPQVLVCAKSPEATMLVMLTAMLPLLIRLTV